MSTIEIDSGGMSALADFVRDRAGRLPGQMVDEARAQAPRDTGALASTGRVIRLGPELWRIIFGEGLPDARAVYTEVGTGPHFAQPPVATDFTPLKGKHPGHTPAFGYIRHAVYRERSL